MSVQWLPFPRCCWLCVIVVWSRERYFLVGHFVYPYGNAHSKVKKWPARRVKPDYWTLVSSVSHPLPHCRHRLQAVHLAFLAYCLHTHSLHHRGGYGSLTQTGVTVALLHVPSHSVLCGVCCMNGEISLEGMSFKFIILLGAPMLHIDQKSASQFSLPMLLVNPIVKYSSASFLWIVRLRPKINR